MPYDIIKVSDKSPSFIVITTTTGRIHSKKPMTYKKALAQLKILQTKK